MAVPKLTMGSDKKKQAPAPTRVSMRILARSKPTIPQPTTRSKASTICSTVAAGPASGELSTRCGFSGGGETAAAATEATTTELVYKPNLRIAIVIAL